MRRRDFGKLVTGGIVAAVSTAITTRKAVAQALQWQSQFGDIHRSYAQFCAQDELERTFYTVRNNRIVAQRLDPDHWSESKGDAPELPVPGGSWDGVPMQSPFAGLSGNGPFQPRWDSLAQYECPEWYQDAKFGIWNHWSPQCVAEDGDWYGRNVYVDDQPQHRYHVEHYGHPSTFGYKDLCPQWTLLNWQPDALMDLYSRAGARLFIALANHHDGFDTWNSRHHPWNAQNIGPRRDVIGTWAAAARRRGMRFGVTVHAARNWWWFEPAHGADRTGALAGVPYDGRLTLAEGRGQWWQGLDPQRLYAPKHPAGALPDVSYVKNFYDRTVDLIDQHDPDLLYFDNSRLPLGWAGMALAAYFYNRRLATSGKLDCVVNGKDIPAEYRKALVADIERGLSSAILPHPWQSETCIGQWHYQRALFEQQGPYGGYMHPADAVHWLIDTVSKNGTFILNVPGRPDGTIDAKEERVIEGIGAWMRINGEAIYATRPWKIFGEGPVQISEGSFQGNSIQRVSAQDIRYTRNKAGTVLYALTLGWPKSEVIMRSLGLRASTSPGRIEHVELLGSKRPVPWSQTSSSLRVDVSGERPSPDYAAALKIHLTKA